MAEPKTYSDNTEGVIIDHTDLSEADAPAKSYVPIGFDSVEEFLQDMRETYDEDYDADEDNREEALDDKRFVAGDQWDPEVLKHREGLPCLTINTVPQFTAQLVGDWLQERPSVKVVPAEDGDEEIASIRGDLIRAIELQSKANRTYANGFESAVQCGDGAWQVCVEYARDDVFDQVISVKPIDDCLAVVWDKLSVDPTGRDARHVFVDDMLTRREFERKWPEHDPSTLGETTMSELLTGGWYSNDEGVRITNYWRMIERDRLLTLFEDGSIHAMDNPDLEAMIERHGNPVKSRVAKCLYAQLHVVTGFAILAGPYEYKLNRLPVIRCSGRVVNVGGHRVRFGLTRFMKDSARLKNFWRSISAEQLGYAPKAQWMATESAVEGREDEIRNAHLSRDPLLVFNDEAVFGQNVLRMDPPAPQAAILNEAQVNAQDFKDVTGIHDASLGIKSNETSGKAIMSRQREGDVASMAYYENANASVVETGDVINQLISQIYDSTRIVRIVGEDQATKFVKINDPHDPDSPDFGYGHYDIAMTSGPSYTTRRVEAAEAMMGAIQVWPQLMEIAGDLVVKAQNWPGAEELAERIEKTIPQQFKDNDDQEQPTPEMVQQLQAQLQEAMAAMQAMAGEYEDLKASKAIEAHRAKIDEFNAETQRIKVLAEIEGKDNAMIQKTVQDAMDLELKAQIEEFKINAQKDMAAQRPNPPSGPTGPSGPPADGQA